MWKERAKSSTSCSEDGFDHGSANASDTSSVSLKGPGDFDYTRRSDDSASSRGSGDFDDSIRGLEEDSD